MDTSAVSNTGASIERKPLPDAFAKLDVEQFLKLLISELQNQDPLNPSDNQQLLQQISEIKNIASNNKLSETLSSVLLQSNLSSASGMIGRHIKGLDDKGNKVDGQVEKVTITDGTPSLSVGSQTVRLSNVAEILPQDS